MDPQFKQQIRQMIMDEKNSLGLFTNFVQEDFDVAALNNKNQIINTFQIANSGKGQSMLDSLQIKSTIIIEKKLQPAQKPEIKQPKFDKNHKKCKASDWLPCAFGEVTQKSQPKAYLFKLLEFNKLELNDNDRFLAQNTEYEQLLV